MRFSAIHPRSGQLRRPAALRRWAERAALVLVSVLAIAISGGEILRAADPGAQADNGMANVLAIRRDPTRTEPVSAELRGVVIYVRSPSLVCLQSKDSGVLVSLPDRTPLPKLGDQLWVEVGVKFQDESSEAPLPAHAVRNEGPVGLPEPTHPWLLGALNGDTDGRWIEVEGYVMQARLERDLLLLHMTDKSG